MNESLLKLIEELHGPFPPELIDLIKTLQDRVNILASKNTLLERENATLLRNQDLVMKSHRELYEENCQLKEDLKRHASKAGEEHCGVNGCWCSKA